MHVSTLSIRHVRKPKPRRHNCRLGSPPQISPPDIPAAQEPNELSSNASTNTNSQFPSTPIESVLIYSRPMANPFFSVPGKKAPVDALGGRKAASVDAWAGGRAVPSASPAWWAEPIAERRRRRYRTHSRVPFVSDYTYSDRAAIPLFPPSKIYGHSSRSGARRKARPRDTASTKPLSLHRRKVSNGRTERSARRKTRRRR